MKRLLQSLIVLAISSLLFPGCNRKETKTASADAPRSVSSAETFIQNLFELYGIQPQPSFLGPGADTLFAPELLGLIRLDQEQSKGEVPFLDYDPICGCQEPQISDAVANVVESNDTAAVVAVNFFDHDGLVERVFSLVHTGSKWKISDIEGKASPSLKMLLHKYLVSAKTDVCRPANDHFQVCYEDWLPKEAADYLIEEFASTEMEGKAWFRQYPSKGSTVFTMELHEKDQKRELSDLSENSSAGELEEAFGARFGPNLSAAIHGYVAGRLAKDPEYLEKEGKKMFKNIYCPLLLKDAQGNHIQTFDITPTILEIHRKMAENS